MKKINEIFQSIQGEGCNTGVPSIFVRFSGCNLSCPFCDTSHHEGQYLSDDEIIEEINKYPAKWVVLTGGEPSLFIDEEFIKKIKRETSKNVAIETNGTVALPEGLDWVTVSPKTGMSPTGDATIRVQHADELKVVYIGQDLEPYFGLKCVDSKTRMLLQPCDVEDDVLREKNTRLTIKRVLEDSRWRLSLQTHKLIGVR